MFFILRSVMSLVTEMLFLHLFIHSPLHVVLFAMATGVMGVSVLTSQVNGLTAALGQYYTLLNMTSFHMEV